MLTYTEPVVVLSTGHMPGSDPNFGELRALEFEFGYVVFVADAEVPDWLSPILDAALETEATLILFDADANLDPQFPVYEW